MSIILDILGSLAVRATIVVVILNVNVSLHTLLYRRTAQSIVKQNVSTASETIREHVNLAGLNAMSTPFLVANPSEVKFLGDVDGNGVADTVHYYLGPTSELSGTTNPTDRKIYRILGSGQPYDFASGVSQMNFEYFDINGLPTTDPNLIKSVSVELVMESGYPFDGAYPSSYWQSHLFPPNI